MPTLVRRARSRLKSAIVPSTYGELSMSSQRNLPVRLARRRGAACRCVKQTSTSWSKPSCVGLTEICASRPAALHEVDHLAGSASTTSSASSSRVMFSPSRVRIVLRPDGFSSSAASIASSMRLARHELRRPTGGRTPSASRARAARRWSTPTAAPCASQTWLLQSAAGQGKVDAQVPQLKEMAT